MKSVVLLIVSILFGLSCQAQSISASREPMYFGSRKAEVTNGRFKSDSIKENQGIDFGYPLCPLCNNTMTQIYSDTAMVNKVPKWIKVVQCQGGNKVLLTRSIPNTGMGNFYRTFIFSSISVKSR